MSGNLAWLATLATVVLLFGYEAVVAVAQRRWPVRMARSEFSVVTRTATGAIRKKNPKARGGFNKSERVCRGDEPGAGL